MKCRTVASQTVENTAHLHHRQVADRDRTVPHKVPLDIRGKGFV